MHETHVPGLLPKQSPFTQSAFDLQCLRSAHFGQVGPPQSMPVSVPFCTPSLQVGAAQCAFLQSLSTQSASPRHILPSAHGGHVPPPQSTSVSVPSFTPFMQLAGTHTPTPLQPSPVPQGVPGGLLTMPHTWLVQVAVVHAPEGQSAAALHATQLPLASQTDPPLSMHFVPADAFVMPHTEAVQVFVRHFVVGSGQSDAVRHATHLPLPSHSVPPWSEQGAPAFAWVGVQQPRVHALAEHDVDNAEQSLLCEHAMPPLHAPVPPLPLLLAPPTPLALGRPVPAPPCAEPP
jgi:hypothetical protein